jgi:hypothetical protein
VGTARWPARPTPRRGTAPPLGPFGLDAVAARPGAAFADARDQLVAQSAQRIAALDDAALVELVRITEADRSRYRALNAARVRGLCLARAQAGRSENTRRWIDHGLGSPAMCNSG